MATILKDQDVPHHAPLKRMSREPQNPHTPERGQMLFLSEENPGYAVGNHYDLQRAEGESGCMMVTYHHVQCLAGEKGDVFFNLHHPIVATWDRVTPAK